MTNEEMIKILTIMGRNYTDFKKRMDNKTEAVELIKLWHECFKDLPYALVVNAVKKTLLTCKYVPTIAEVRENCLSLIDKPVDVSDLWIEAHKMLSNGIYMTAEQFETYPIECQKFFGNTMLLRQMSSDENINLDVVRSNFYKRVETTQIRDKKDNLLPQNLKLGAMIGNLTDKFKLGE
jgi:hypothetical protein